MSERRTRWRPGDADRVIALIESLGRPLCDYQRQLLHAVERDDVNATFAELVQEMP